MLRSSASARGHSPRPGIVVRLGEMVMEMRTWSPKWGYPTSNIIQPCFWVIRSCYPLTNGWLDGLTPGKTIFHKQGASSTIHVGESMCLTLVFTGSPDIWVISFNEVPFTMSSSCSCAWGAILCSIKYREANARLQWSWRFTVFTVSQGISKTPVHSCFPGYLPDWLSKYGQCFRNLATYVGKFCLPARCCRGACACLHDCIETHNISPQVYLRHLFQELQGCGPITSRHQAIVASPHNQSVSYGTSHGKKVECRSRMPVFCFRESSTPNKPMAWGEDSIFYRVLQNRLLHSEFGNGLIAYIYIYKYIKCPTLPHSRPSCLAAAFAVASPRSIEWPCLGGMVCPVGADWLCQSSERGNKHGVFSSPSSLELSIKCPSAKRAKDMFIEMWSQKRSL